MHENLENWFLRRGSRYAITGPVFAIIAVIILPAIWRLAIWNTNPLYFVCSGLITGNITLITVVVAINQVILSRAVKSTRMPIGTYKPPTRIGA